MSKRAKRRWQAYRIPHRMAGETNPVPGVEEVEEYGTEL
jgi:hypothetical protein